MQIERHIARALVERYRDSTAAVVVDGTTIEAMLKWRGVTTVLRGHTTPYGDEYLLVSQGGHVVTVPAYITIPQARARLGDEMTLAKSTDGEFRVNYRGGSEDSASYTNDLWDAVHTGCHMRDNRIDPHWQRTAHGVYRAGAASVVWDAGDQGHTYWHAYVGTQSQGVFCEQDERRDLRNTAREDAMKACDKPRAHPNVDAHEHMIALGYRHTYCAPDFDDGDAENGPSPEGSDEYDQYESDIDYVIMQHGKFVHHELRDLALEAYINGQRSA